MTFNEADWNNIRNQNFGVRFELCPEDQREQDLQEAISKIEVKEIMPNIFDEALEKGVIIKRGTWYYFNDKNIGQGKKARNLTDKLKEEIYESLSSR